MRRITAAAKSVMLADRLMFDKLPVEGSQSPRWNGRSLGQVSKSACMASVERVRSSRVKGKLSMEVTKAIKIPRHESTMVAGSLPFSHATYGKDPSSHTRFHYPSLLVWYGRKKNCVFVADPPVKMNRTKKLKDQNICHEQVPVSLNLHLPEPV